MDFRTITELIIVAVAVLLIAWDCVVAIVSGYQATISRIIYETSCQWPLLPFAIGFLMGHFFFPQMAGN